MNFLPPTVRAVLAFTLIGAAMQAAPTPAAAHDPLNRETPQSSVVSFLEAAHAKDYNRALRYIDLRQVPENQRLSEGSKLAQQLATVLDQDPRFISER